MKKTIAVFALLMLAALASAERVAVVVDLPTETYAECVDAAEDSDAYEILGDLDLDMAWSYYGSSLGHGLCGIGETGCPSTNCYCSATEYWGFYVKNEGDDDWTYSQVGFDGGTSCSEHYCSEDEDTIGFAYGEYGTEPSDLSFDDVCCGIPGDQKPCGTIELSEVISYIGTWSEGKASVAEVVELITEWSRQ